MMTEDGHAESEDDLSEQSVVTVVGVQRYMTDPVFRQQTGLTGQVNDAYDLSVADGQHRRKIVLSTALNQHIQKRMVCVGDSIRLKRVKVRFDETDLSGQGIPILEDMEVVDDNTDVNLNALSDLPWHPKDSKNQQDPEPLASSRAYYVDVWSTADVVKTADSVAVEVKDSLGGVTSADLYSLREVAKNWRSIRECKPRLLVRVMRRPRLVHYARPDKTDKWPFQLPLVVGDCTGCCVAVFWNIMAPRYLPHVQEGSILLVRNFTVKPRFQMPEHRVWHPAGLPWFDIDININAHHPQAEVTLLHTSVLDSLHDVNLPLPVTNFVTRKQMSSLPDDFMCDAAGVITFVGAWQREKMKVKHGYDSGGFWIKRWVHVRDHSNSRPIIIQLYRGAQRAEFEEDVRLGRVLVCRHLRVVHGLNQLRSSRQPLHVYLSSTRDTHIYMLDKDDDAEFPFCHDATLQAVLDWAATASCRDTGTGKLSDMFFSYPPQPTTLEAFSGAHENLEIVPSDTWKELLDNLSYRESTRMVVQALLASASYCRRVATSPSRQLRRRKEPHSEVISILAEKRHASESEHCEHLGYVDISGSDAEMQGSSSVQTVASQHSPDLAHHFAGQNYLHLQWQGLNTDIILDTVKYLHLSSCPANMTVESLLSGSHDAVRVETNATMGEDTLHRLVASAKGKGQSSLARYLVVLDVFCVDGRTVLMNVNRAFPIR